ncbi:uncharacterized protein EURHEDRAFT_454525 [Aspergillus ruber CBS 135680]|uniref:Uncharacterized protein n=1 Tax=Aspergillus ruber (strain CBS 135680) TaxID=1388766 RepID=A0A017SGL2_ASPRC|nr:uncharacterized protein EURHEDRAFT_454525 [Aspergillus ruber CBS 135680]EYE95799.1 hypothetical protein EURHEDRAFT_454525 [Aspergillus ruber CBS 135680]
MPVAVSQQEQSVDVPMVSFENFAVCYRQNVHKQSQRKRLEHRLHATKVSIAVSARLTRIGAAVQRGMVESLKQDDKINFVNLYNTLHELQESCESATRRPFHHRQDPLLEDAAAVGDLDSVLDRSPDFFRQLSPQSQTDLLDILHSVRTDPEFLFDRLRSLTATQLATLVSSATTLEAHDPLLPSNPRTRTYPFASSASATSSASSFTSKRVSSGSPFQDHALACERTDALATLLFNTFAAPLDAGSPEARLRVDVWSSVCAKLITHGGNRYYPLVGHILSAWALCSDWKARPQFELYLMDILQTGAFLLEHIDAPAGVDAEPIDPLKTNVAEEFFASAVNSLFNLLDDSDAGLPHSIMELGSAILQKLGHTDLRNRFMEYLFVHWFFSKFLYGALAYPEAHGLLLDFHIRKDAREKLLGQVGLRAYSQVFTVLRSAHHSAFPLPMVRQHVDSMFHRFQSVASNVKLASNDKCSPPAPEKVRQSSSVFLMLSATDVLSLLNVLFPRAHTPVYQPSTPSIGSPLSSSPNGLGAQPGFFRSRVDPSTARESTNNNSIFSTDAEFLSLPDKSLAQAADRIRFELSDLLEPHEHRANLEHPSNEDWTIFSVPSDGKRLTWGLFSDHSPSTGSDVSSNDGIQSTAWGVEKNYEALQTAIVKLVKEGHTGDYPDHDYQDFSSIASQSLEQRFDQAMTNCNDDSDFIGAHYWWNASRQLARKVASPQAHSADDSWILHPMHASCARSLQRANTVIERCERDFVALDRKMQRLQRVVKDTMTTVTKLRNKMWYMTDVKNSMRYEDAKNVALALKTMIYSARLYKKAPTESRSRGTRSFGGSLLQKPELQVMDVIKAASSQGGPNKLSDEQVELTRKWLSHSNIDNFCRGEERIHRFCYEVKTSINRLVGETMSETPVLWSSELFQKERAKFEGPPAPRNFLGLSNPSIRPFGVSSEDSGYHSTSVGSGNPRPSASVSKLSQDIPALQSLFSDKWKSSRDSSVADTSSIIGDSPGKTASTTTGDSCSTFWSSPQPPTHYAASASSLYSRPPSMLSDTVSQPPRRRERNKAHEKTVFLDGLKQTLTSLLLSDLGSPVWSCGSETDAWFGNALDKERIQMQMEKRARVQRFYDEYDERSSRPSLSRTPTVLRKSRSLEQPREAGRHPGTATEESSTAATVGDQLPPFSYETVFRRLIDVFSRHGNPFVKLQALRDLRAMVIASLNTSHDDQLSEHAREEPTGPRRSNRYSISGPRNDQKAQEDDVQTPTTPAPESVVFDSRPSDYTAGPTENQIVDALRSLILEMKPKTIFRDLQFISAFVPGDTLNKTDSGTAFVQFGLAALSLKDEVCNSMVEIADEIVSNELTRRHLPQGSDSHRRPGHAIEDAAGMWIITAKEGNPVAQRELAILYLTHPELLPRITLPLTLPRDTFKAEMMYHRDEDSKSDPQSMCLALHWMQLSANGGDELARNRLREREEFESIA